MGSKAFRFLIVLILVCGCAGAGGRAPAAPSGAEEPKGTTVLNITGTVVHVPLEGGFYGIEGDDGQKYDPRNLPEDFKRHNLPVRVVARPAEKTVGFHMWGRIIDIVRIERR